MGKHQSIGLKICTGIQNREMQLHTNSQGPLAANDMNLGIKLLPNKLYTILFVILYRFRKSYASLCISIGAPPFWGSKPPFFRYILKEKKYDTWKKYVEVKVIEH